MATENLFPVLGVWRNPYRGFVEFVTSQGERLATVVDLRDGWYRGFVVNDPVPYDGPSMEDVQMALDNLLLERARAKKPNGKAEINSTTNENLKLFGGA